VDKETIHLVYRRASHRCEYCLLPEAVSDLKHVIDHIIARQHGGSNSSENLALCCVRCNQHKGPNIAGIDPHGVTITRLFNPRMDCWTDHFKYDGPVLTAKTDLARATVVVLAINHPLRITARQSLLVEGVKLE
jgi:hypothetical protein